MTTSVTFLCPHAAGKSVAAAAYFAGAARAVGLDVSVSTAGTEPDAEVMPQVREHLENLGLTVHSPPRPIAPNDLAADHVVNIGCDLAALPRSDAVESWDDVPMISDDLDAAMTAIKDHVERFIAELA